MKEIKELIKIANRLDQAGLTKEADQVDALVASLIGDENPNSSYMSISNIKQVAQQAMEIAKFLEQNESVQLEDWIEDKLSTTADDIEEVYNYLNYHVINKVTYASFMDNEFDDDLEPKPELVEAVKRELLGKYFEISNDDVGIRNTLEEFEGVVERLWDISDPDNVKHQDQIINEIIDAADEVSLTAKGEDEFNLRMFKQFLRRYI